MKLPKWKLKLMEDLIKDKVALVKTRIGYQYININQNKDE